MLIDVHAHQFPQKYIETVTRHGRELLVPLTRETIDERLSLMDAAEVDVQVLSPANLVPYFETQAVAVEAARILNDGYAETHSPSTQTFQGLRIATDAACGCIAP